MTVYWDIFFALARLPQPDARPALPISIPLTAGGMRQRRARSYEVRVAVGRAAVLFPPYEFVGLRIASAPQATSGSPAKFGGRVDHVLTRQD